jgi:hypothetical protein
MFPITPLRWIGLLLLLGVILFSAATIVAEPFEQETALNLYQAIAQNGTTYQTINLLAGFGFILVVVAWVLLARYMLQAQRRWTLTGLTLLALATLLWLVEVGGRLTTTTATANQVSTGTAVPTTFPANLGVGLEPLFIAFLATTLAGLAILFWQVGLAGLLSKRWSLIGAAVIIASGAIAALTYPWVGGIERALFYPFVLVLLPFAIFLLVRR